MKRVHIAFVSPEHCDIAAELEAVAKCGPTPGYDPAVLCTRYGAELATPGKPFAYAGGVAVVPIYGLLLNRFPGSIGMATGYDFIRGQLRAALADPDVSHIVFDIHSGGGMAAGCEELAQEIYRSREAKPSLAVVDLPVIPEPTISAAPPVKSFLWYPVELVRSAWWRCTPITRKCWRTQVSL